MINVHFDTPDQEIARAYNVYQYDRGQKMRITGLESLELPNHTQVHFALDDEETGTTRMSTVVDGVIVVDVPFRYTQYAKQVTADIYIANSEEGKTIKRIYFTPKHKAKPDDDITPDEERTVDRLIDELIKAKEKESADVEAAANSARDAANSATTAIQKATEAKNSAQTATQKASEAANSAQTAVRKATEVESGIQTAIQKATEASNSAVTATQKAEAAANSAKTAGNNAATATQKATEAANSATNANSYSQQAAQSLASCEAVLAEIADKTIRRYGVRWLDGSTAAKGTRLGDAASITKAGVQIGDVINENEFDNIYPWNSMRRCNGEWNLDTGIFEVSVYEFNTDGTKNETFKVDGSNGNVWVEIPLFWAKHIYDGEKEEKWVSGSPGDGYYIPAKLKRSMLRGQNKTYIAAFRASADENGHMVSIAGATPKWGSFNTFMTAYKNEGVGLSGTTSEDEEIIDLLMDVEFATRDQQSIMLGEVYRYWGDEVKAQLTEENTNRIVVANSAASNFRVGENIGIGTSSGNRTVFDSRKITAIE